MFYENDFNSSEGVDPNDFSLSGAHGDDVWLLEADAGGNLTRFVEHVSFGAAVNGESFGRWPNGTGKLYPMSSVTLGAQNSGPRVGSIVISEVMYNPPDPGEVNADVVEFVEIYNPTNQTVDLTEWRLRGGIDYNFVDGTMLGPGGVLVVVPFNPTNASNTNVLNIFRSTYGIDPSVPLIG
ncbi:MAG: lamin tail domain-containing protein, partial [Candidatus Heimdallarchaeota archaeon]|nr:lamin tail domain-containing protein [Candidatus Heimdallarchaeota archaeon]